jgi:hypothetical protein
MTGKVDQRFINGEGIGVVLLGLGRTVKHGLQGPVITLKHHIPTDDTMGGAVYIGDDVRFVFLFPMKVNNSSNSLTASGTAGTGGLSGR